MFARKKAVSGFTCQIEWRVAVSKRSLIAIAIVGVVVVAFGGFPNNLNY
jgi:hypothetical protein